MSLFRLCTLTALVLAGVTWMEAQPRPQKPGDGAPPNPMIATQDEAAAAVQRAYDGISHATALGGGRGISTAGVSTASLISQSKNAYQQSLSLYQAGDYVGAREQAMASADFAHAAEELTMSSDTDAANLGVPRPPTPASSDANLRATRDVQNLSYRLAAMNSSTNSNSGVPGLTGAEAKSLLASSQQLQQQAQSRLAQNQCERAIHLAHAGDALTHVAEHLQNRYLIAAGIMPTPPPPPPGPDGAVPPPPGGGAPPPPPQP